MSDTSVVSARKYRPKRFDDLIGQNTIAQTLSLALDSNRLSHAYLFSGLRGSGKTSTARIFAKSLVCEKGPTSHPCESCIHCIMANENRHMDIIEMDAASSRKIDDIRDLIEHTKYRPASAAFKIFIIDEVHMLTKEAFNALLKTLEEPPSYVKFILATTDPLKLPATILSRTQHFRFKFIGETDIVHHLEHILNLEQISFEPQALTILARSGNGSVRDTLTLLDQAIIYSKNFVDVATVTEMLGLIDPQFIEKIFVAIFEKNAHQIIEYVKELIDYEADMVIDELISFLKERLFASDKRYHVLLVERFFRILSDSKSLIGINADGSFVLTLLFFKMMEALKLKDIDSLIKSLEADVGVHSLPRSGYTHGVTASAGPSLVTENESANESPSKPAPIERTIVKPLQKEPNQLLFERLSAKIMDRNAHLGRCFLEGFTFISFDDPHLVLQLSAQEECTRELRSNYKDIILPFILEIFGTQTKVEVTSSEAQKKNSEPLRDHLGGHLLPSDEAPVSVSAQGHSFGDQEVDEELPAYLEPLETSTAPLTETLSENFPGGSCVSGCEEPTTQSSPELDRDAILQEPMVQKAIELFGNKVTIQNKI